MKVATYYRNDDVRIEERARPRIGAGEVLVRVVASGICGTDVMEWYRLKKAPLVLGHEIAGEIVEVGAGVEQHRVGQRVFVSHHVPCNTCRHCLRGNHTACHTLHTTNYDPGGFAEYVRIPALQTDRGIFELPEGLSFDAGTLLEPLACVVRGQRVSRLRVGDSVLILGSGVSGLLHLLLARTLGAGRIFSTDTDEFRLEMARELGASPIAATDDVPARVRELNDGRLADLVIVSTGARSAFDQALASVGAGGTILCFATTEPGATLPVPINEFWRNGITLVPSYGAAPTDLMTSLELLHADRVPVERLISHRLPLTDAARGFRLVAGLEHDRSLKVILHP